MCKALYVRRFSRSKRMKTLNLEPRTLNLELCTQQIHLSMGKIDKVAGSLRLDSGDGRCYKSPAKEVVECNL